VRNGYRAALHPATFITRSQAVARIADRTATQYKTRSATFGFGAKVVSVSAVKHDAALNAEFNATFNAKIIYVHLAPGTVSCQLRLLVHFLIDMINVKKIIINVNKRVYSEKDSKRL